MHAYERHAYEMAPVRGTPMKWPMKWPMKDARLWETRLWDGLCEKHAYEGRAYEMAAYERHVYGMVYWRCTPIKVIIVEKGFWKSRPLLPYFFRL